MSSNLIQQNCVKEPEIETYYNSERRKESNSQQLADNLIKYAKQQCENDPTSIATAYRVVDSTRDHLRKKEILGILLQQQQQQISKPSTEKVKPSTEKVKPQISEESRKFAHDYKEELSMHSSDSSDDSSTQPLTGTPSISDKERQKKLAASLAEFADYKSAPKQKSALKQKRTIRSMFGFGGNKTKKSKKGMSLCAKKTAKKCTKVRGCKVASGKKRTYCRKKKNHTQKSNKK
jgi:hypothetical protein